MSWLNGLVKKLLSNSKTVWGPYYVLVASNGPPVETGKEEVTKNNIHGRQYPGRVRRFAITKLTLFFLLDRTGIQREALLDEMYSRQLLYWTISKLGGVYMFGKLRTKSVAMVL